MTTAVLGKTDIGISEFGYDADVPNDPKAQLMYYIDCICYALDIDKSEPTVRHLRNFRNHRRLSREDTDELLILCALFSPDELINKCIFMDEEMCDDAMNKFYELKAVSNRFVITENILIAGERRAVKKILCFRKIWLEYCYIEPISHFQQRLKEIADRISGRQRGSQQQRPVSAGPSRAPRREQQPRPQTSRPSSTTATTPTSSSSDSKCAIL